MTNAIPTTDIAIDSLVRVPGDEDNEIWRVTKVAKGWYTLAMVDEPAVTQKARLADIELVDESELQQAAAEEEEAEEVSSKMAEALRKYRAGYKPAVAASGKKSLNNGDPVAIALEYMDWMQVMALCSQLLLIEYAELEARYAHLNIGARRMNCGNRIRAAYKKGDARVVEWVNANQNRNTRE